MPPWVTAAELACQNLGPDATFADGVITLGSPNLTSAGADFKATDVGKTVTGAGIPAGTTIASRTSAEAVVLSAAATATDGALSFTIVGRNPNPVDLAAWANTASELLERLSGRAYGQRDIVIRPNECDRCAAVGGPCGEIGTNLTLPGYVAAVTSVTIDGVVLPASAYRLYEHRRLVRIDGKTFPCCQRLSTDAGVGTWEVAYTQGRAPTQAAKDAAGELACELAKAKAGDPTCRLPARVQSISRQGVSMTILDPQEFLADGRTGLYLVDLFLSAVNPSGARRRSRVWSPDVPQAARRS